MPKSVYTSPEFLALEMERIFAAEWLCAGRADALKKPGDYVAFEIAGEPILVLRDRDNRLRAMSNVCRHRMSTLLQGRGTVRAIVCPYHAWTYNLDGTLRGAPAMGLNESFRRDDIADFEEFEAASEQVGADVVIQVDVATRVLLENVTMQHWNQGNFIIA